MVMWVESPIGEGFDSWCGVTVFSVCSSRRGFPEEAAGRPPTPVQAGTPLGPPGDLGGGQDLRHREEHGSLPRK